MERWCGGQVGEKGREGVRREDRRRGKDICKLSSITSKSTHPMLKAPPSPTPSKTNYVSRVLFLGTYQWASFISPLQRHSWSTVAPVARDGGFPYFVVKAWEVPFLSISV